MTNRQRFGMLLMTSALLGGYLLPAAAVELTPAPAASVPAPPPAAVATPAPVAAHAAPVASASPATRTATRHATHKVVARFAYPVAEPVPFESYEVASSAPTSYSCRFCGYPMIFGIAY